MINIKVQNLIIGGGPSGLTAGYLITKDKQLGNVEIIESSEEYVGGISRTESKGDFRFDIGGHRFFSKSKTINALWDEILDDGFIETNRKSRILFKKNFLTIHYLQEKHYLSWGSLRVFYVEYRI